MYQKKLICIRNFWYVSEISDMYHKILICIIKFWYVSEISDTYFFQDASEISDIVQKQTTNAYCKAHPKKNNLGSWQPAALESEYLGKQSRQLSLCLWLQKVVSWLQMYSNPLAAC